MTVQEKARALRPLIEKAAVSLTDSDALEAVELFPEWAVGIEYATDFRFRYGGKLWRVRQTHISQIQYPPSIDTAALYMEIEKPGEGDSIDNPIIYNGNMKLILGKYYKQNDVVYYCIRDTGNPVYNNLSDLIDIYVEVAH